MKVKRQNKIIELVKNHNLTTQDELSKLLKEEGFKVTQATISRDIRELNLTKANVGGVQKYVILPKEGGYNDKYVRVLREGYISMDMAHNILVLKTVPGMAMAVATAVDNMHIKEIAGCIAGDDTIFLAIRNEEQIIDAVSTIKKLINN